MTLVFKEDAAYDAAKLLELRPRPDGGEVALGTRTGDLQNVAA